MNQGRVNSQPTDGFALPTLHCFHMALDSLLHHFEQWKVRCLNGLISALLAGIFLSLECHRPDTLV